MKTASWRRVGESENHCHLIGDQGLSADIDEGSWQRGFFSGRRQIVGGRFGFFLGINLFGRQGAAGDVLAASRQMGLLVVAHFAVALFQLLDF